MIIGIDASNIRAGGGLVHLIELLKAAEPKTHGFSKIIVWGSQLTLDQVPDSLWLLKQVIPTLNGNSLQRSYSKLFQLPNLARYYNCDLLLVPSGSYVGNFHPTVTISQNLLPFDVTSLIQYRGSLTWFRLALLRLIQIQTFRSADGVIFLTHHGKSVVEKVTDPLSRTKIIAHGLNPRFLASPRRQKPIESYSTDRPFRLIYVSIINHYKNQWHVVEAIAILRQLTGWPLVLDLVGPAYPPALRRLQASLAKYDPDNQWVYYHDSLPYDTIHEMYLKADLGLWASTCETFGMILLETMGAGLAIASSDHKVAREILAETGVYFDAKDPQDIAMTLQRLIASPELRTQLASANFTTAQQYTWKRCADETFSFLINIHSQYRKDAKICMNVK